MKTYAIGLIALGVVLVSSTSFAQTTTCTANCTVYTNQPFTVSADDAQPASQVDGYRLYDNNAVIRDVATASARAGNVVSFVFAQGLPATGAHSYQIAAYNITAETKSTALAATVLQAPPIPTAPGNIRLIK